MLNPIHTRKTPFFGSPFASIEDIERFIDRLTVIVDDAIGHEPQISISLTYPDYAFPVMSQQEFREAMGELPFEALTTFEVTVFDGEDPDFTVGVLVTSGTGRVSVRGRSVTRVDGVDVQVRKELNRLWEAREDENRQRQAKKVEAVGRVATNALSGVPLAPVAAEVARFLTLRGWRSRRGSAASLPAGTGLWRRFANNPWTITIIGGAIAAAIAVGLVALVILLTTSAFSGGSGDGQSASEQTRGTVADP